MQSRIDYSNAPAGAMKAMRAVQQYVKECGLEPALLELVKLRASQINGCAFCIDMHTQDARAMGESEQRLYMLNAWREALFYADRERAALAWTESVTLVADNHVPDSVYEHAREQFGEQELVNLTMAVIAINGWNRLGVGLRWPAGDYRPKRHAADIDRKPKTCANGGCDIMKYRQRLLITALFALVAPSLAVAHGPQRSEQAGDPAKIMEIFSQALPKLDYHKVSAITVEYAPGGESTAHRHDVAVFAYILRGRVESQLKGEAPRTFGQGEMWYEPPGTVHLVSRNASNPQPARLLVFFVQERGKAPTTAIE